MTDDSLLCMSEFAVSARAADVPWADISLAAHRPTGRACVVMVWRAAVHRDDRLSRRVAREVDAARALQHPGIAAVVGRGTASDGRWFVASEYAAGPSIADVLDADGRLTPARFIRLARLATAALAAAHAAGVYHGYLTPDNVIVASASEDGRSDVIVSGFGTAAGRAGTTGQFVPPVADRPYLSPERIAGAAPSARSDVFSLASVLQFALDGSPPLAVRADADAIAAAGSLDDTDGAARWHRTVSGVLARARSAAPDRRHASVRAFRNELLAVIAAHGSAALAAPEFRALDHVLDQAELAGALTDGGPDRLDVADRLLASPSLAADVHAERWVDRVEPLAPEPLATPSVEPSVRRFTASTLRPELEVASAAAIATPHQTPHHTPHHTWRPVPQPHFGPPRGHRFWRRADRARRIRAALAVVGVGMLAYAVSLAGWMFADRWSAPPVARGPLADLSVPTSSGQGKAALAVRAAPGLSDRGRNVRLSAGALDVRTKDTSRARGSTAAISAPPVLWPPVSDSPTLALGVTPTARVSTSSVVFPILAAPSLSGGLIDLPSAMRPARDEGVASSDAGMVGAAWRRDVEAVVARYTRAVEARDLVALGRVYPAMTDRERDAWRTFFRATDDVHAQLTVANAQPAGELLRAEVRGAYTFRTLRPRGRQQSDVSFVAILERAAGRWRMRSVR